MKLEAAIKGFLLDWQLRNRSAKTLYTYGSCLGIVGNWLAEQGLEDVEEVTIHHLRAFLLHTSQRPAGSVNPRRPANKDGKPPSVATLQGYVKVIKVWFHWLVDEEVIGKNPAQRLEKPQGEKRIMVSFSDEHLNQLV